MRYYKASKNNHQRRREWGKFDERAHEKASEPPQKAQHKGRKRRKQMDRHVARGGHIGMVLTCGERCWYCGVVMTDTRNDGRQFHSTRTNDHVDPKMGTRSMIAVACAWCNVRKGSMSYEEFRTQLAQPREGRSGWGGVFYGEGERDGNTLWFATRTPLAGIRKKQTSLNTQTRKEATSGHQG